MGLFAKTIDGIIADITQKITALHTVAEVHAEAVLLQTEVEDAARAAREFAQKEFNRAKALAAKFEELVKV